MVIKHILHYLIFAGSLSACITCGGNSLFPERLDGMQLIRLEAGERARGEVNRLHGRKIPVKDAWIALYRKDEMNSAMIWVSESFNIPQAAEQTGVMMKKIMHNPRSPFHHLEIERRSDIKIYLFSGMSQRHAVFRKGMRIYWISATRDIFRGVLDYYVEN
jgi:hypothetical protein